MPQKTRSVRSALIKKGFQEEQKGRDHAFYFFHHEGKKSSIFTKISHGQEEIGDGLCAAMARQMRLSGAQFRDFVDCRLSLAGYANHLLMNGHIFLD